jgi:hypothetical protein
MTSHYARIHSCVKYELVNKFGKLVHFLATDLSPNYTKYSFYGDKAEDGCINHLN